mgnify:CR=1 FL=1
MQLPPASYDFSTLYLPGTYPNTPRELFTDVFYPNENPFPRSYLDDDFYKTLFEDLADKYKGTYINPDPTSSDDDGIDSFMFGLNDSNLYINTHLYQNSKYREQPLERNLEYAPFFLTFWEGQPMIGYVWEKDDKSVFTVGYLDENTWVHRPSRPMRSSQNDGRGWYSDQFLLFPMRSNYGVLNYPEGI